METSADLSLYPIPKGKTFLIIVKEEVIES